MSFVIGNNFVLGLVSIWWLSRNKVKLYKVFMLNFTTNCIVFNFLGMLKYISFHFILFVFRDAYFYLI